MLDRLERDGDEQERIATLASFFSPSGLSSLVSSALAGSDLPHMRATQAIPSGSKIGIYWETYNTNTRGEGIQVAITVAPGTAAPAGSVTVPVSTASCA